MKCNANGELCDGTAEFICPECETTYCSECSDEVDYECDCIEPPRLERLNTQRKSEMKK